MMNFRSTFWCSWMLLGCSGQQTQVEGPNVGSSESVVQSQHDKKAAPASNRTPDEDAIEQAARPFTGFRLADQLALSEEELFTYLAAADAVCIGERHDSALDHFAQLRALDAFVQRRPLRGFELGFAMEMVQSSEQYPLSEYLHGRMSRDEFVQEANWETTWGFPIQYYDPQMRLAQRAAISGVALGVSPSLTRHVAELGLDGINASDQRQVPELDLDDADHRRLFDSLMGGHPLPKGAKIDHFYQAQVVWDESMAKRSRAWVNEHRPMRKLLIFAGQAHCHRTAIPKRMERGSDLVVLNLLSAEGAPRTADDDLIAQGYEYQIVFE